MRIRRTFLCLLLFLLWGCNDARNAAIEWFTPEYRAEPREAPVSIQLEPVFEGFPAITEMVFLPGSNNRFLALQKDGSLLWFDIPSKRSGQLLKLNVLTSSEQGLLGLAFSPTFARSGLLYLYYSVDVKGKKMSRISEWKADRPDDITRSRITSERILLEIEQPYANHNAGRLEFGPDGYLYIGLGDGGWRGDPERHGQNGQTLLGSILRIDVRPDMNGRPYSIPPDNPQGDWAPEVFAIGLRNPWKFSFAPDGRLIVADVGQDRYEEISIVRKGGNYGWNIREGFHCYEPPQGCRTSGLIDPIYEYSHDEGKSITGGYVYTGSQIPFLRGKYVFADFVSGWMRAITLPQEGRPQAMELGKWPILIATFGRAADGELYVADFGKGTIYRLRAK
jgi:glucose/arabinose dehydrogenase